MKAILEIDVPDSCKNCPMMFSMSYRHYGDGPEGYKHTCALLRQKLPDFGIKYFPEPLNERNSDCPLKIVEDTKADTTAVSGMELVADRDKWKARAEAWERAIRGSCEYCIHHGESIYDANSPCFECEHFEMS